MLSQQKEQLPPYQCIVNINRVGKNIHECLLDVEATSASSRATHTVGVVRRGGALRRLCTLEQVPDTLLEVMRFLYPTEWGRLAQTSQTMADLVTSLSEVSIAPFLLPHLLLNPLKAPELKPEPYTIEEFRVCDPLKPEKSLASTYQQIAVTPLQSPVATLNWGPNMKVYQRLITMDITGVWRVSGSYTSGDRYCYTMRLQQIGHRRGATKLEAYLEGEVRLSETAIMVIGGKIEGNMAVFHEILMLDQVPIFGPHPANVVSAVISDSAQFMSGAWMQHDPHILRSPSADESTNNNQLLHPHRSHEKIGHHYPLRFLCSGSFSAAKQPEHEEDLDYR